MTNEPDTPVTSTATSSLRGTLIVSLLATMVMALLAGWIYRQLPADKLIPVHWNVAGEVDRYGSRATVFLLPGVMAAISLLFYFLPRIEPRRSHLLASSKAYRWVWLATLLTLACIQIPLFGSILGYAVSLENWLYPALGVLFLVIGNFLGKVRSNFIFGVRTPWTLSSELSWNKTHRLCGWLFMFGGLLLLAGVAFQLSSQRLFVLTLCWAGVLVVISAAYSYFVWRADPNKSG